MTSVTFLTALGGDGTTVTDDSSATTGLGNGGHRYRFVSSLVNLVAIAQTAVNAANTAVTSPASLTATSVTSLTVGTGSKSITLAQTGKGFNVNSYVTIASSVAPATYMYGQITAFTPATGAMTVNVIAINGSGTIASWMVNAAVPNLALYSPSSGALGLFFDGNNMAIGGGPSPWTSSVKALDFGYYGAVVNFNNGDFYFSQNTYYNGTNWIAKATGAGTLYKQSLGTHTWYGAASVSAGATQTFTLLLGIDASGNMALGTALSSWGAAYKALEVRTGAVYDLAVGSGSGLAFNAYNNGTNWVYKGTGGNATAMRYEQIGGQHVWFTAPSGIAGPTTTITSGQVYTVTTLSSTTLAQWQAFFSGLVALPTVGQSITATATGTLLGGATVTQTVTFAQAMSLDTTGKLTAANGFKSAASGFTFPDNTVQATATRNGMTAVTLTSAAPNATLTSASNQFILIKNDTTKPTAPSITLPAMNAAPMAAGTGYFILQNTTPYNVAIKDAGGTVREYIAPGCDLSLNISDISTANGQWNVAFPASAVSVDSNYVSLFANGFKVTANNVIGLAKLVRLDTTNFALVWVEYSPASGSSATLVYAKLLTVNTSTKAITVGNTVTLMTFATGPGYVWPATGFDMMFDSDGAGHALVVAGGFSGQMNVQYAGLSVSGGVLYASAATSQTATVAACASATVPNFLYCGYLGGSNAFAFAFALGDSATSGTIYVRGCTITGTTTVTLTNSANNTTVALTGYATTSYGARTDLTTFVFGNGGTIGRAITYTPATNTFAIVTRTNQARLDIEQGAIAASSSFAQGGFMFSSGKAFFGANVYDITNVGVAGVTATLSVGFNYKVNLGAAYASIRGALIGTTNRSSIYVSTTSMIAVDGTNRFQCDPSQTTLNLQKSAGVSNSNTNPIATLMLDTNLAMMWYYTGGYIASSTGQAFAVPVDVATPITL